MGSHVGLMPCRTRGQGWEEQRKGRGLGVTVTTGKPQVSRWHPGVLAVMLCPPPTAPNPWDRDGKGNGVGAPGLQCPAPWHGRGDSS